MYRSKEKLPGAWICSNENDRQTRGRLKNYQPGSKIYLRNGDEFEIELFNPTDKNIKAVIEIDGKSIAQGGLILRPGERMYLECFPDSKKKFTFKTYQVENSNEVKQAIRNNGKVSVKFYREKVYTPYYCNTTTYPYPYYWDNTGIGTPYWTVFGSTTTSLNNTISSNIDLSNISSTSNYLQFEDINDTKDMMKTGQVEGGNKSDQEFEYVDMTFETFCFKTYTFKILPLSQKPLDKKDFKKKKKVNKKTSNKLEKLLKLTDLLEKEYIDKDEFNKLKSELI